jgi:hypothetical protein
MSQHLGGSLTENITTEENLTKNSSTVRTAALTHGQAAKDSKWKK